MTSEDRETTADDPSEAVGSRSGISGSGKAGHSSKSSKGKKKHLPVWQETFLLLAIALGLAIIIKAFFVQAFYIPSPSMEPGLVKNDRILVEKVSYWGSGTPQRGDVVVFKDPGGWLPESADQPTNALTAALQKIGLYPTGGHLVKRVIGVAGDTIHCCDAQGRLTVNGVALNESSYVKNDPNANCRGPMPGGSHHCNWTAGPVPAGHIFVMGDNRNESADSSAHLCQTSACNSPDAYVPTDLVVGKVFVLLWPSNRFHFLHRPSTFADVPNP